MVRREHLINAIRQKQFHFKRQADRVELYKQAGSTKRVEIPRRDLIDPAHAAFILRQAGYTDDEVRKFLAECDQKH